MDPYVEPRWGSFHSGMTGAFMAALNASLPSGLEAHAEEHVQIEDLAGEQLRGYTPDVYVVTSADPADRPALAGSAAVVAEPIRIRRRRAPIVSRTIQIVDARDGSRVITAIELLSPWNKLSGRLNRDYRRKVRDYQRGGTNWVEVDLLRSSRGRLPVRWDAVATGRRSTYMVVVYRAAEDEVGIVPVSVRQPLPTIGVPLREGEPDVALDLQAAFARTYAEGPFKSIDYRRPPDPPLSDADAAWAADLLRPRSPS